MSDWMNQALQAGCLMLAIVYGITIVARIRYKSNLHAAQIYLFALGIIGLLLFRGCL